MCMGSDGRSSPINNSSLGACETWLKARCILIFFVSFTQVYLSV